MSEPQHDISQATDCMITITLKAKPYLLTKTQLILEPINNDLEYIPATLVDQSVEFSSFGEDDVWSEDFLTGSIRIQFLKLSQC